MESQPKTKRLSLKGTTCSSLFVIVWCFCGFGVWNKYDLVTSSCLMWGLLMVRETNESKHPLKEKAPSSSVDHFIKAFPISAWSNCCGVLVEVNCHRGLRPTCSNDVCHSEAWFLRCLFENSGIHSLTLFRSDGSYVQYIMCLFIYKYIIWTMFVIFGLDPSISIRSTRRTRRSCRWNECFVVLGT